VTAAQWLTRRGPRCMWCAVAGRPLADVCHLCNPLGTSPSRYEWVHPREVESELRASGRHATGAEMSAEEVADVRLLGWKVGGTC